MSNKHHKPEEIVAKLRQVEVLVGQGKPRIDAIREVSVTDRPIIVGARSMAVWGMSSFEN